MFRNPDLRRLELAWGGFFFVEWTSLVALSVWAYDEGGPTAVGLIGLLRLLPAAVALPFGASLADRFSRNRVLTGVFAGQACALAATAVVTAVDGPAGAVYVLVAAAGALGAPCRPAQLALAPLVARSPRELVGANVAAGTFEGIATLLGPALAGLLLAFAGPALVLGVAGLAAAWSAALTARIAAATDPSRAIRRIGEGPLETLLGGVREIRRQWDLAVIIGCFVAQLFVRGLLNVLLVSVSFALLEWGEPGVGLLGSLMGAGGLAGAVAAVGLTGRRRLAGTFALALTLWGAPIAVLGVVSGAEVAIVAFVTIGVGNALLDVSGFTMLQRIADDRALGRVFGVFYTVGMGMSGLGSVLAPALIDTLGLKGALIATGAILPAVALAAMARLPTIDAKSEVPEEQLGILAKVPLFASLPPTTLEKVASHTTIEDAPTGTVICREGDSGERFYVIATGRVEVTRSGRHLASRGSGDHFGEIALLRDMPRTATVTAVSDTRLGALSRDQFLAAVFGNEERQALAERVVEDRLARS